MKSKYLKELTDLLDLYEMESLEKSDIVLDYSNMYDDALDRGMTDEETLNYLGSPKGNIKELTEGYKKINKARGKEKYIALTPFIALVIFLILGFQYDYWHPGWLIFLLIPVSAIIIEMGSNKDKHILTALSPFVASITFLYLGFFENFWHPGWLVFLIIPVIAIITERKSMKLFEFLVALSPFVTLVVFFILGEKGYWHPGWLIFFLIPAIGYLNQSNKMKLLIGESLLIAGVAGFWYLGEITNNWALAVVCFVPIFVYSLINGDIEIVVSLEDKKMWYFSIAVTALFLILGLTIGYWVYIWLLFLLIPVASILIYAPKETQLVSITPFISFLIFFLLGMIAGLWMISWMAFLLIPVVAIIKES